PGRPPPAVAGVVTGRARRDRRRARPGGGARARRRAHPAWPHERPDPGGAAGTVPRAPIRTRARRDHRPRRRRRDGAVGRLSAAMPLVLASSSPRRHDLLRAAGIEFTVVAADVDESPRPGESPTDYVTRVATDKAMAVVGRMGMGAA